MNRLFLVALCAVALGCNPNTDRTSPGKTTQEQPPAVTTNRPIILDDRQSTTQPLEASNSTQTRATESVQSNDGTSRAVDPDNTEVNARDRDNLAKTPFDQKENSKDIEITADIRKRVVATEMSVNAQNVKIITQDGKVTLRGPVESADEKSQIEKLAQDVAGIDNVANQLDVQP